MSLDIKKLQNSSEEDHLTWISKANLEQISEYLEHFGTSPNYSRMALARQQKLQFEVLRKPHWTITPTFWLVLLSVLLSTFALLVTLIADWTAIQSFFLGF